MVDLLCCEALFPAKFEIKSRKSGVPERYTIYAPWGAAGRASTGRSMDSGGPNRRNGLRTLHA
jgi:hypothetical protein